MSDDDQFEHLYRDTLESWRRLDETHRAMLAEVERLRVALADTQKTARAWEIQANLNDHPEYWEQLHKSQEAMDAAVAAGVLEVSDAKSMFERERLRRENVALRVALTGLYDATADDKCEEYASMMRASPINYHDFEAEDAANFFGLFDAARAAAAVALGTRTETEQP